MSLAFSNTTSKNGIIQRIEDKLGFDDGVISGSTLLLAKFTAKINSTFDSFFAIAIQSSGTWQIDDSNQTDLPFIKTNLVSGQRVYSFTTDGSSNLILDVFKAAIYPSSTATTYTEIYPFDAQSEDNNNIFDEVTTTGVPSRYDKTANAIILDIAPSYNATNGLKLGINREASYFTTSDTTKKPGVPGIFHDYFILKPSYEWACDKQLSSREEIYRDLIAMEKSIADYFARREKDNPLVIAPEPIIYE